VGVVVAITPFNFPAFIPSFKIGAALIAGNAVVWKPAEQTPLTGVRMVEALMEAGLPPGVLNYVTGNGAVLGPALLNAADVSAVTFTGSTRVGLLLARAAAERHIRIQHEMGGKNPLVVLADCDLEEAVAIAADGAFGGTGQKCTATSRIFVEQAVYDDFVSALADRAGALRVGNGLDTETDLGPLVSAAALEKVTDYIDIGVDEGAKLIGGTVRPNANGHSHGHFVAPAIFVDVHPGMRIMREEIFGPVVGVMPVSGYEEAAALCNDTDYGLSASIVTRDLEAAQRFTDDVEAGVLNINLPTTGVEYQAPFGGLKNSGSAFKECGSTGVDFFLVQKTVAVRPAIPSRRPPAESAPTTGAGV
jgi:aldehyde dehydrogenase (NAD+)